VKCYGDDGLQAGDVKGALLSSFQHGQWVNEPARVSIAGDALRVTTDARTDFWRETYYGFTHDSGHFYGFTAGDAFTAQIRVRAEFKQLYDQAGIMVRLDAQRWLKAGLEFSDGHAMLSSVLTDGRSDWATGVYAEDPTDFWMRVSVANGVLRLQVSGDGVQWPLVRLCPFPVASHYLVGPMCCTPERAGLQVTFSDWALTRPLGKELHDLT
jgi:regulation of enolase protein 1 (concanavalin A-like superfamily)